MASRAVTFTIGDRVLWAGEEFTVWSMHVKNGWRWLVNDKQQRVAAKVSSLTYVGTAALPQPVSPARRTDPGTSHAAAKALRPGSQQHALLAVYGAVGVPLTDTEAAARAGLAAARSPWKRCGELRAAGLIRVDGEKRDPDTHLMRLACVITEAGREALRA